MTGISLVTIDDDRVVTYNGKAIKVFSKYDDFAFTKATEYHKELRRISEEEFRDRFPEFFL